MTDQEQPAEQMPGARDDDQEKVDPADAAMDDPADGEQHGGGDEVNPEDDEVETAVDAILAADEEDPPPADDDDPADQDADDAGPQPA